MIMQRARELQDSFARSGLPIDLGSAIASIMDEVPAEKTSSELGDSDRDVIARLGVDPMAYAETKSPNAANPRLSPADLDMIARLGLDPASYLRTVVSS